MRISNRLLAALVTSLIAAQTSGQTTDRPASGPGPAMLSINDGGTTKTRSELELDYAGLAAVIGSVLKKPVRIEPFTGKSTKLFGPHVASQAPDAIWVKTIDAGARAIRDSGYHAVVRIEEPYLSGFIMTPEFAKLVERKEAMTPRAVPVSMTLGTGVDQALCDKLAMMKGSVLLLPGRELFTSMLAVASLRACKIRFDSDDAVTTTANSVIVAPDVVAVRHISAQDGVAETVERGLYPVGAVNSSTTKKWRERRFKVQVLGTKTAWPIAEAPGVSSKDMEAWWKARQGHVLAEMPAQPNWALMVSPKVTQEQRAALAAALLNMNDRQKERVLKPLDVKKFVPATDEEYLRVLVFIGG